MNSPKFIKYFESKVKSTIKKYKLASKKDKIIVACSGGKDSTTTLYLLKKLGFNVEALHIDLLIGKWSDENRKNLEKFCKDLGVRLHIINMREEYGSSICYIRSNIQAKQKLTNCAICGVIKKWILNKKARELLKGKKARIATGHNLDDEAETVLMNFFKGSPNLSATSSPKTGIISDKKFVKRIKPLYFLTNKEVAKYSKLHKFPILYDPCVCLVGTLRKKTRKILAELIKKDKDVKHNIVNNFLRILPILIKQASKDKQIRYYKICSEPSRGEICKRCKLLKVLKSP